MTEFFIAKRHILDRKFQSFVSIIGIAISLSVFVVSLAISNGLKNNMLNSILALSPHISVDIYEDYQEDYKDIVEKLKEFEIKDINTRIEGQGIVNANGTTTTNMLVGTNIDLLDLKMEEGTKNNEDLTKVLVGNEFLRKTNSFLGDEITIISSNTKEIRVKIGGVFKTGYYNYDSDLVIFPLETMQLLQEKGDVVSTISINVSNPTKINKLNNLVNEINFNFRDKVYAHSWSEDNQSLLSAINFEKFVLVAILSLIVIIASFAIAVILNMIVREKTTDIGILKAVGYTNKNILKIFLLEGMIIGFVGILISLILAPIIIVFLKIIFKYYVSTTYYLDSLPISINILEMFLIYISSFVLILLSTIIPSLKAAKMEPTDAIKYNN